MAHIQQFGPFEVSPKKGYVSLRTSRQFAMIGPVTKTSIEIGINVKTLPEPEGWTEIGPGNMCNFKRRISTSAEITDSLIDAIRRAYSV
jgi:hypothetical protein